MRAESLHGVVEAILDAAVRRAVEDPLPVHTAADVRAAARAPVPAGLTTLVVPAVARVAGRWSTRVVSLGSRVSFSVKALLAAVPPLASSLAVGTRELHALGSLVVNRLRAAGHPVEPRFVQRVTVNAYAWPGGGRTLEDAQAPALVRIAGLWLTRPLAGERAGDWVGRAAEAIEAADLGARLARYREGPPALGP
jgi:hypothetical protein